MTKKVFIKTFGCQMNEYDSDKMADVMGAAEGYEPTQDVEEADLILFNTCSVREKAQEKVFSDLGRVKHLKNKGVLIGVGGCVASQEGAAIIERAPYVDVVFGPQTLHRLPQLLAQRRAARRAAGGHQLSRDREVRPPAAGARRRRQRLRAASWKAAASTAATASCRTRAAKKSRAPSRTCWPRWPAWPTRAYKEVTLLGQNVNAYRGKMGETAGIADFALLIEYVAEIPGIERIRYTTSHPERIHAAADRRLCEGAQAGKPPAPAGAARQRPHPDGDEARLHRDGIQEHRAQAARDPPATCRCRATSSSASRGDRRRLRKLMKLIDDIGYDTSFSFIFSPRPGTPAATLHDETPHDAKLGACSSCRPRSTKACEASATAASAPCSASWSKALRARTRPSRWAHRLQPHGELQRGAAHGRADGRCAITRRRAFASRRSADARGDRARLICYCFNSWWRTIGAPCSNVLMPKMASSACPCRRPCASSSSSGRRPSSSSSCPASARTR